METSINERINSQMYSDVINSYPNIDSVTATRNIVAGSVKETVDQCVDQTISTLNSAGGQTLFTRLRLSPTVKNATLVQLAKIYFQYYIPENSLGVICAPVSEGANTREPCVSNTVGQELIKFKLLYDGGFSLASMVQLCLGADAKISTENFNAQQTLLTLNSLPDYVTQNSTSETSLKAIVENENLPGVGSGIIETQIPVGAYGVAINKKICIEGLIDLDRGNPLFHNFPIITRNMSEIYLRLHMENFLRNLKVVYLNKRRAHVDLSGKTISLGTVTGSWATDSGTATLKTSNFTNQPDDYLPYQLLPADKPDFIYLNGVLTKIKLINIHDNVPAFNAGIPFKQTKRIMDLTNIHWTRFEVRRIEFDVEDYEDIKASQGRAGVYKFPVHLWKSKPFDQTNQSSNNANALQTTLNYPNIDRLFITSPLMHEYPTFLPTLAVTDINPQLDNQPVLPRTEDNLNIRTVERIGSVYVDTDKYSMPDDLFNSLFIPIQGKHLWEKSSDTYGGAEAFCNLQRGLNIVTGDSLDNKLPIFIPNKYAYALELNEGGCFRRGVNSVIGGMYKQVLPINIQQSTTTSADIYFSTTGSNDPDNTGNAIAESKLVNTNTANWNSLAMYGDFRESGAVSTVHCLCDYIFKMEFDQYGLLTNFYASQYDDR